jgi:hypothetical protein
MEMKNLHELKFQLDSKMNYIHAFLGEGNLKFNTELIKVLKPIHSRVSKKNNEKKYIILDFNNNFSEKDNFELTINKIHEISQENTRSNSLSWFNIEFDSFELDSKVKRPIDMQKNKYFIKILIDDNENLLNKMINLQADDYIACEISFLGMKIYGNYLSEEYLLTDFLNESEYNESIIPKVNEEEFDFPYENQDEIEDDQVIESEVTNKEIPELNNIEEIIQDVKEINIETNEEPIKDIENNEENLKENIHEEEIEIPNNKEENIEKKKIDKRNIFRKKNNIIKRKKKKLKFED